MKVALVHSFYSAQVPSGENALVLREAQALAESGHDVTLIARYTDTESMKLLYGVRAAFKVATGRGGSPIAEITAGQPDVVHVHNLFPNFGTDWLRHCTQPLFFTIHNYRWLCASANLFREGSPCHQCQTVSRYASVVHGCYRGSRLASVPLALHQPRRISESPLRFARRVIFPSRLAKTLYVSAGLRADRCRVVPNPAPSNPYVTQARAVSRGADRWVYVGRLSPDKGLPDLLRIWPEGHRLDIVGSGPLEGQLQLPMDDSVRFIGKVEPAELQKLLPSYAGLVFPSQWYEVAPLVLPEALAAGLPVVALRGNSVADEVDRLQVGETYVGNSPESLVRALTRVVSQHAAYRDQALETHASIFSERAWVDSLLSAFAEGTLA